MKAQLCWFKGRIISSLELLYVIGSYVIALCDSFYRLHFLGSWASWLFPRVQVRGSTGRKLEWGREKPSLFVPGGLSSIAVSSLWFPDLFQLCISNRYCQCLIHIPQSTLEASSDGTCTHLLSASLCLRFEQAPGVGDGQGGWPATGWTWPSWRKGRPKVPRSDL